MSGLSGGGEVADTTALQSERKGGQGRERRRCSARLTAPPSVCAAAAEVHRGRRRTRRGGGASHLLSSQRLGPTMTEQMKSRLQRDCWVPIRSREGRPFIKTLAARRIISDNQVTAS